MAKFVIDKLPPSVIKSLRGPQGIPGPAIMGDPGVQGEQGPQGLTGATGPRGPRGDVGPRGEDGLDGKNGTDGADGKDGSTPIPRWDQTKLNWIVDGELIEGPDLKGDEGEKGRDGESGGGGGGMSPSQAELYAVTTADTDIGVGVGENTIILADASSGDLTVNLPLAGKLVKFVVHVKKIDTTNNTVTIQPRAGETIDDQACFIITKPYTNIMIVSNSSEWYVF